MAARPPGAGLRIAPNLRRGAATPVQLLRAASWAIRAGRLARRQFAAGGLDALVIPTPPSLPPEAVTGVLLGLRLQRASCVPSAAIRQAWYAAHGDQRDIVLGVTAPGAGFRAHAWLEGDPRCHEVEFHELLRRG